MINPKPNEYGLANTQTSLPNCDKQQPALIKKTALRDLQNDNRSAVPKPLGISHFLKEIGRITDTIKVSGNKRQTPECPSSPGHQSPSNNNANGHLLYTRRKSNSELGKNSTCEITESVVDCPPMRQLSHGELGTPHQQMSMKEHKNSCFAAYAPIPMASLMTFSSGGPTVSLSMGKNNNGLSLAESNYPTISSGVPFLGSPETSNQHWKERFLRLQAYLRTCDHSSQEEYIQSNLLRISVTLYKIFCFTRVLLILDVLIFLLFV